MDKLYMRTSTQPHLNLAYSSSAIFMSWFLRQYLSQLWSLSLTANNSANNSAVWDLNWSSEPSNRDNRTLSIYLATPGRYSSHDFQDRAIFRMPIVFHWEKVVMHWAPLALRSEVGTMMLSDREKLVISNLDHLNFAVTSIEPEWLLAERIPSMKVAIALHFPFRFPGRSVEVDLNLRRRQSSHTTFFCFLFSFSVSLCLLPD